MGIKGSPSEAAKPGAFRKRLDGEIDEFLAGVSSSSEESQ